MSIEDRLRVVQAIAQGSVSDALAQAVHGINSQKTPLDALNEAITGLEKSGKIATTEADRLRLANRIAELSNNNIALVKAIESDETVNSLRDFAIHYDASSIANSLGPELNSDVRSETAAAITRKVFEAEPTASVAGLVGNDKIALQDPGLKPHVLAVLSNPSAFDLAKTPVETASKVSPEIFENVPPEKLRDTIQQIKLIQRVQAIAPTPEAIPVLINQNMTTAFAIASASPESFVAANAVTLGNATAHEVWSNATSTVSRNERTLASILEMTRGSGLAVLDRVAPVASGGSSTLKGLSSPNFEALFGSNDQCSCDDCTTVYSPAAYLCEILQYLRNNNLDPRKLALDTSSSGSVSIQGTALEKLLLRRPDIAEIELSCENTNVALPYIDLANEVMESFIVHTRMSDVSVTPQQYTIDAFNVSGMSSQDLLSSPANMNVGAYATLATAVYPFSLPYHQAIDAQRTFLGFLNIDRASLLDTFRSHATLPSDSNLDLRELQRLQRISLDRQVDAESLGMTLEEYVVLTKESFRPKIYYNFVQMEGVTDDWYTEKIGLKTVPICYGYDNVNALSSANESARTGLMFVKKQFLKRSGLSWPDLVEIVQTSFINPNLPRGRDLDILQSLKFSYKFLKGLVQKSTDESSPDDYTKLADFLVTNLEFPPPLETASGESSTTASDKTKLTSEIKNWAVRNFKTLGNLIVLESNQGPELTVSGWLSKTDTGREFTFEWRANARGAWYLHPNGNITTTKSGPVVATVDASSRVIYQGRPYTEVSPNNDLFLWDDNGRSAHAYLDDHDSTLRQLGEDRANFQKPVPWVANPNMGGTCNIDDVTLVHLDGSALNLEEWDRMQRFTRLRNKLGWSINEVDMAAIGISRSAPDTDQDVPSEPKETPWTVLGQSHSSTVPVNITPSTIHHLSVIKSIVQLTGLSVEQVLTFWAPLPTRGPSSLFNQLFFTRNLPGNLDLFKPDANGTYFSGPRQSISENTLTITSAFNMKVLDIKTVLKPEPSGFAVEDSLSMDNLTQIYRISLLSKILFVQVSHLASIRNIFGTPTASPEVLLSFLQNWFKMQDAGLQFDQIDFVFSNNREGESSAGPNRKDVLQTCKLLYDGLQDIQSLHKDANTGSDLSAEFLKSKAQLIFDTTTVANILSLTEGTGIYSASAPPDLDLNTVTPELAVKLKYITNDTELDSGGSAHVVLTGILTEPEIEQAKALVSYKDTLLSEDPPQDNVPPTDGDSAKDGKTDGESKTAHVNSKDDFEKWGKAIDTACAQPKILMNDTISGMFSGTNVPLVLVAPDFAGPADPEGSLSDPKTALQKRTYFLEAFLPRLRQELSETFIIDTIAGLYSLDRDSIDVLLDILHVTLRNSNVSAKDILTKISWKTTESDTTGKKTWKGYILPPSNDQYVFSMASINEDSSTEFVLNGQRLVFNSVVEPLGGDKTRRSTKDPIRLNAATLYEFSLTCLPGDTLDNLSWKSSRSPMSKIPSSALLPNYSQTGTYEIFDKLQRCSIIISQLPLTAVEIEYISQHSDDFANFDFNSFSPAQWKRLNSYVELRDSFPKNSRSTLIDLFRWATNADHETSASSEDAAKGLSKMISEVSSWDPTRVSEILKQINFASPIPKDFKDEIALARIKKLFDISEKTNVEPKILFKWAILQTESTYDMLQQNSVEMQKAARSGMDPEFWNEAVRPLNDKLRENRRDAMVKYLLVQSPFVSRDIEDADGLFEFFLIDVQMSPLMETSRIKSAISAVQTFVQRCQLGLEFKDGFGVGADVLDRGRWNWMKNYRVWEANRKIYLYPENWADPSLRDDKSEMFKAFEGELLQNELTKDSISQALKNYVYGVVEVANLITTALLLETADYFLPDSPPKKLHVFARTRTVPFKYFYRWYSFDMKNWYPWEDMQIEIPSYVSEATRKTAGVHMAPVIWSNRLFVFIPQMTKQTVASTSIASNDKEKNFASYSTMPVSQAKPTYSWEIKMSWTEYKDGHWTPRAVSSEGFVDSYGDQPAPAADTFTFFPALISNTAEVSSSSASGNQYGEVRILVARPGTDKDGNWKALKVGEFGFAGGQLICQSSGQKLNISNDASFYGTYNDLRSFGYWVVDLPPNLDLATSELRSYQSLLLSGVVQPSYLQWGGSTSPYVRYSDTMKFECVVHTGGDQTIDFYHKYAPDIMNALQSSDSLDRLYDMLSLVPQNDYVSVFGAVQDSMDTFHELNQPYSLYNWELGLHAPMLLIDRLLKSQQFEDALSLCHYIFNPLASGKSKDPSRPSWERVDPARFWAFAPFRKYQRQTIKTMEEFFMQDFKAGMANDSVNEWRDKPFQPHVVARSRPKAYMKWVVMKYIEILIAYGDYYFRLNTLETIPNAIQMYVLASHLYGPRSQTIKRPDPKPKTYMSLLSKFDAFSNAMVELEEIFPFSNQTPTVTGIDLSGKPILANIYGFANTLYFAIPNNPTLVALGTTIDDRLFKIRHCQNIDGVQRLLPLFEPPIDPGLLVQATAQNLSLSTVLADLKAPMPSYRFQYMLNMALELANELKSLGNSLLSTREKRDGEALALLRAKHERAAQTLILDVKKLALEEATKSLEAQEYARTSPVYRLRHHLELIGADPSSIPQAGADFQELASMIEKPSDDGGLKLSAYEKEANSLNLSAQVVSASCQGLELVAGFLYGLPTVQNLAAPLGVGVMTEVGPGNAAKASHAACTALKFGAEILSYQGAQAGRKSDSQRLLQERILQANLAGYEISALDRQILASKIRVDMANREIANQQKQMDQAKEMEDFLKAKYSNVELYSWMEGSIKTLFYSTYTQAYDFAKQAENAFHYERPQDTNVYIPSGFWDPARGGLLSGERLSLALKQLQNAYQSKRGYDYEITKHISLRQLDPLALISLRETGTCDFSIPEALFDMDFPGHYLRRIKSISVTIPCVVGPCTTINSTLKLNSHKYRTSSSAAKQYPEELSSSADARFATTYVPIQSIAVTSGDNDPGVFELNFRDERYVPFEGAGAISSWNLELPTHLRQFAYESITDVVLHMRYTSLDGGPKLKDAAIKAANLNLERVLRGGEAGGLYAIFDIRNEFATGWSRLTAASPEDRVLQLPKLNERLPVLTRGREARAVEVSVLSEKKLPSISIGALVDGQIKKVTEMDDNKKIKEGVWNYTTTTSSLQIGDWALKFGEDGEDGGGVKVDLSAKRVWMLVRYMLKKVT